MVFVSFICGLVVGGTIGTCTVAIMTAAHTADEYSENAFSSTKE